MVTSTKKTEDQVFPRILIIDHDDSYTLNLLISLHLATGLTSTDLSTRVLALRHTHPLLSSRERVCNVLLPNFDAIILSPGPGRPDHKGDFDASSLLLNTFRQEELAIPTLGICLGHQGIGMVFGAKIHRAKYLRHGLTSNIEVLPCDDVTKWPRLIDHSDGDLLMTTYNSLVLDENSLSEDIAVTAVSYDQSIDPSDEGSSERIVMGIQHKNLPLWGVQFHPESIASTGGVSIVAKFLENTRKYWQEIGVGEAHNERTSRARERLNSWERGTILPEWIQALGRHSIVTPQQLGKIREEDGEEFKDFRYIVNVEKISEAPVDTCQIFETLFASNQEPTVWLDSARPGGEHSRYSFMAKPAWSIEYNVEDKQIHISDGSGRATSIALHHAEEQVHSPRVKINHGLTTPRDSRTSSPELCSESDDQLFGFWTWMNEIQTTLQGQVALRQVEKGTIPLLTGFLGYFGYEMKHESLPVSPLKRSQKDGTLPSAWFGFCNELLAFDHFTKTWYAVSLMNLPDSTARKNSIRGPWCSLQQSLKKIDASIGVVNSSHSSWMEKVRAVFRKNITVNLNLVPELHLPDLSPLDSPQSYKEKVNACRDLIAKGESYELCLTTEFHGRIERKEGGDFTLYKSLRKRNPAPFSAFIRLNHKQSILSTSPEKYLGINAHTNVVEMKPIKGTRARAGYGKTPYESEYLREARKGVQRCQKWIEQLDLERQNSLQCDAKERAENLMIVDLIRRDLLAFCSPDSVHVPVLMGVESYETVHQLVTTVQGKITRGVGPVEALGRCFPPGSMTGAPKLRSVEHLQSLEAEHSNRHQRGVYSGVLGWLGVDGSANFSVIIRTVVLDGQDVAVGAGGAITYPSKAEREWEEVLEKVSSLANVKFSMES